MLSLKISISTAANAPSPASSDAGDLSTIMAITMMTATIHSTPLASCASPLSGSLRLFSFVSTCIHMATTSAENACVVTNTT